MGGTGRGNTVQYRHTQHPTQNRVMVMFGSSAAVFELPRAATLEDLAGPLAHLSERHDETLMSVDVRVGSRYAKGTPSLRGKARGSTPPALARGTTRGRQTQCGFGEL